MIKFLKSEHEESTEELGELMKKLELEIARAQLEEAKGELEKTKKTIERKKRLKKEKSERAREERKKIIEYEKRLNGVDNIYEIFSVIEEAPEEVKEKAWKKFLEQNPDKNDLNLVTAFCSEKYRKKAEEVSNKILEEKHS